MGEQIGHEFSLNPVDTGRVGPTPQPTPMNVGGIMVQQPNPAQPITRPSFLQSFLANLGPALAGGMAAQPGAPFGTGLGGALQGVQQHQQVQFGQQQQLRQQQIEQQSLAVRAAQEQNNAALIQARIADFGSKIDNRGNPKNPIDALSQQYTDALARGKPDEAQGFLKQINDLSTAKKPPAATSPWGKLSPEMAAIGVPPNPNDKEKYPLGQKDPAFQKDVAGYGGAVTALKQKNAMALQQARGRAFASSRAQYQQIAVLDKQNDNNLTFATPIDIAKNKDRYEPASQGATLGMKNAVFEDMNGASANLREAYKTLDAPFNATQIAKMTAAMRDDPSGGLLGDTISNLTTAKGKEALTPGQQKVAIAMLQNYENAFALRGVAGFGAGSDQLRGAIKATLPGPSSPPEYALKQLDAYDAMRSRLARGIPNAAIRSGSGAGSAQPKPTVRFNPKTGKLEPI